MNKLYAYKYWDGHFHKLMFSRSEDLKTPFVRVPEFDTEEKSS